MYTTTIYYYTTTSQFNFIMSGHSLHCVDYITGDLVDMYILPCFLSINLYLLIFQKQLQFYF